MACLSSPFPPIRSPRSSSRPVTAVKRDSTHNDIVAGIRPFRADACHDGTTSSVQYRCEWHPQTQDLKRLLIRSTLPRRMTMTQIFHPSHLFARLATGVVLVSLL